MVYPLRLTVIREWFTLDGLRLTITLYDSLLLLSGNSLHLTSYGYPGMVYTLRLTVTLIWFTHYDLRLPRNSLHFTVYGYLGMAYLLWFILHLSGNGLHSTSYGYFYDLRLPGNGFNLTVYRCPEMVYPSRLTVTVIREWLTLNGYCFSKWFTLYDLRLP